MSVDLIKENDLVFLILDERRRWLVQVRCGEQFHTHKGIVEFNDLIGKPFGSVIYSRPHESQGHTFYALKPLPSDYVLHMSRKTQIIYPEDAGLILIYSGIGPGKTIIEAGAGSGALTCILGTFVQPYGRIYSYDVREKSIKRAKKNVERAGLQGVVDIQYGDILNDDLDHSNVDAIVLDMPQPWEAVKKVKNYMKLGGVLVSFSPTVEQVKKTTFSLRDNGFIEINTYELMKRTLQVKENATRPEVRMIGHTGYITFGRRVIEEQNPYREKKPSKPEKVDLSEMPLRN